LTFDIAGFLETFAKCSRATAPASDERELINPITVIGGFCASAATGAVTKAPMLTRKLRRPITR
jgi:hypothetical protein